MTVIKNISRVPNFLDSGEAGVVGTPIPGSKVYGFAAGCISILELRDFWDRFIKRKFTLQLANSFRTP